MKLKIILMAFGLMLLTNPGQARPVSYPGGWTLMQMNDGDSHSLHIHYSPAANYSVGLRNEYMREGEYMLNSLQTNILLKRWNKEDSQANLYLKSGAGLASQRQGDNKDALAVWSGLAADWETRRWFTSYEARGLLAGDIDRKFTHKARIGVAPYVADYGALHTWLMVEVGHDPKSEDEITVTPLVRFFKGPALLEAGFSNQNDVLFNFIYRF
jgi:hypothetical protein